jgi:hypothetical protein
MAGEIGISDAKADNIGFEQRDAPVMPRDVFWVGLRVIAHRPRAAIERVVDDHLLGLPHPICRSGNRDQPRDGHLPKAAPGAP